MAPNGSKVQEKKNRQGYESWEMYSSEEECEYEFETLRDYESDNSDTYLPPVFMQNLESPNILESIEKSWCETQKFQTTFDTKEHFQSKQQPNDSGIPKKGSQAYIELVRQCKQNEAKIILTKIISTNSPQRVTASDDLEENRKLQPQGNRFSLGIFQGFQLVENEKPINGRKRVNGQNSKSENLTKPNDEKLIFARKSSNKVKPSEFDKAEKLKQSNNRKCMESYEGLKSILAEKGIKSRKPFEIGRPKTTLEKHWKKSIGRQNSKSEKEFKENSAPKGKIDSAGHESINLKRKVTFNDTILNAKQPKNCENSVNDEKLIYAEKSTAKKKPNKVDKSANLKQLKDAEKSTSGQKSTIKEKTIKIDKAEILKQSNNAEKSTSGQKLTIKEKTTMIDKAENLKQSNNAEKSTSGQKSTIKEKTNNIDKAKILLQSNKTEKSTSEHKSIDELMSEVVESSGKFFCPENCGKSFPVKHYLRKHLLSHRPKHEWPYVCLFCGQHSQARADLPKHFKSSKHINDSRIPRQGTPAWDDLMAKSVNTI